MPSSPLRFAVDGFAGGGPSLVELQDGLLKAGAEGRPHRRLRGTLSPGVVDAHVHLGLVDRERLAGSAVVEVHDLGWLPAEAARFAALPPAGVAVLIAGPFLTSPGGYPTGRSWAPQGAVRAVADEPGADAAIGELVALGASRAKVTLHAAFPDFAPGVLERLVAAARRAGLPVVAHVEGPGRAERALAAGVDTLAHVPWTERLPDPLIRAFAARTTWISTLALHTGAAGRAARHNARRFLAAGGRLRYGTDLGNGPIPVGVHPAEVLALGRVGLEGTALIAAMTTDATPLPVGAAVWSPAPMPSDAAGVAAWFTGARRFAPADLEEHP